MYHKCVIYDNIIYMWTAQHADIMHITQRGYTTHFLISKPIMLSAREDSCFFVILLSYPRTAKVLFALCEFDISPITGWPKASN